MPLLDASVAPRVWLGHAAKIACHHDTFDNLACVIAGARRFTLFSPESIDKLYVGPIDHTMAGPPVSLAASAGAHDVRFPLFRQIEGEALIAELLPGDALYLPKLWWHQVESLDAMNMLVNYWWGPNDAAEGLPIQALLHAMLAIKNLPPAHREGWHALFDHFVFESGGPAGRHLPEERRGVQGQLEPDLAVRLRATIGRALQT